MALKEVRRLYGGVIPVISSWAAAAVRGGWAVPAGRVAEACIVGLNACERQRCFEFATATYISLFGWPLTGVPAVAKNGGAAVAGRQQHAGEKKKKKKKKKPITRVIKFTDEPELTDNEDDDVSDGDTRGQCARLPRIATSVR